MLQQLYGGNNSAMGNNLMGGLDPQKIRQMMMLQQMMQRPQQQPLALGGLSAVKYPALGLQSQPQTSGMNPLAMMLMSQAVHNQLMNG